ncbi:MAG: hypothetical protein ISS23_02535 [Nanoarchaeota archaeon]|nr:hypothetical protein [Nanoarchaeota archaeon]
MKSGKRSKEVSNLERKLRKIGSKKNCTSFLNKNPDFDSVRFFEVFDKLKSRFGYKTLKAGDYFETGFKSQFERVRKLSELSGDVLSALDALASTGYKFKRAYCEFRRNKSYIQKDDVEFIEMLTEKNVLEDYLKILNKVQKYEIGSSKNCSNRDRALGISKLLKLECDVPGILDTLAGSGYRFETSYYSNPIGVSEFKLIKALGEKDNLQKYLDTLGKLNKKTYYKTGEKYFTDYAVSIFNISQMDFDPHDAIITWNICSGYNSYFSNNSLNFIEKIAKSDSNRFFTIFMKLESRFGYKTVRVEDYNYTGGVEGQVGRLLELCDSPGNVWGAIDALADSGYKLDTFWDEDGSIGKIDVDTIKKLARYNSWKAYSKIFTKLNSEFNYEIIDGDHKQIDNLIELAYLGSKTCEAIDSLISSYWTILTKRYSKLGEKLKKWEDDNSSLKEITSDDIDEIKKIVKYIWNRNLENMKIKHKCFYKENVQEFVKYFSNIKDTEEKEAVVRSILNCSYENKDAIQWLNNNESELIRKIGLEP